MKNNTNKTKKKKEDEPELYDRVVHKASKVYGEVRAKYQENKKTYLDVLVEDKMHYHNNINNWEIRAKYVASQE